MYLAWLFSLSEESVVGLMLYSLAGYPPVVPLKPLAIVVFEDGLPIC